jgi:hypothetical protein
MFKHLSIPRLNVKAAARAWKFGKHQMPREPKGNVYDADFARILPI